LEDIAPKNVAEAASSEVDNCRRTTQLREDNITVGSLQATDTQEGEAAERTPTNVGCNDVWQNDGCAIDFEERL
jgi:hypothetical protein